MKKYIFFLVTIFLFCFLVSGCNKSTAPQDDLSIIKERGYLIVGVKNDSPPFGYYKNKKLVGIDIKLAKEIANSIFKNSSPDNIKYVIVNPQNRILKLNSKEVDILVATMSVNEKRKLVLDFSLPYFVANQKLLVRQGSKITNLQYFNSKGKIAIVLGATGDKILHLIAPNARIVGAKTYPEAYKLLQTRAVDAVFGDDCILEGINSSKKFKLINRAYSNEYYAVALRKSENSKELMEVVNSTITMLSDEKKLTFVKRRMKK